MINQVTNLIQFKNLSKDEQVGFDFESHKYLYQAGPNWYDVLISEHPIADYVYRLVIQPEKFYYWENAAGYSDNQKGEDLNENTIEFLSILRPATSAEIPKPEVPEERGMMFQLGIQWKGGKFYKMHLDDVEIDPKDLLSHMDFLAGIKS